MIKAWIFEFFPAPAELAERFDPAVSERHFNAYLDLWAYAESVGFDGIFFSEHHFGAGYSPAPHLLVASVALRTSICESRAHRSSTSLQPRRSFRWRCRRTCAPLRLEWTW